MIGDRVMWRPCETCRAEAEIREQVDQAERDRLRREEAIAIRCDNVDEFLERKGVNRKCRAMRLEDFCPDPDRLAFHQAQRFVSEFAAGERPSLYLYSERPGEKIAPGCGKTHLAVGIMRALTLMPEIPLDDVSFAFVPRMLLEIQATFKHPEKSELSVVKKYATPELLIWDDFGAEKLSDYAARTLYTILYEREGKSNIFTSNLSLDEIEARDSSGYTQRITSRIAGDSRILCLTGPDRRLEAA